MPMSPARRSQIRVLIIGKLLLWQKEVFGGCLPRKGNSRFGELLSMIEGVCAEHKIRIEDMGKILTEFAHENVQQKQAHSELGGL